MVNDQDQNLEGPIPPEVKQITILCTSFSSVGTKTPTQDEGGRYMLTTTTETPDWLESDG